MSLGTERILTTTLWVNAAFSTLSALGALAFNFALQLHLDLEHHELVSMAYQLLVFAGLLVFVALRLSPSRLWTLIAAGLFGAADLLWVLGSGRALIQGIALTSLGIGLIVLVAIGVGCLGTVQLASVLKLLRGRGRVAMT